MVNPEIGFTSDVITNPKRFVGRIELLRNCLKALNTPLGLIGIHGKRGVGKSSLARQIQQIAIGNYTSIKNAGIIHELDKKTARKYLTIYYQCDAMIDDPKGLIQRLLNDQSDEDGLLRLVPNEGKEIVEFSRVDEEGGGIDLKVANWGVKDIYSTRFAKTVENDIVQTFRNYISAIITHQVNRMKRDGLLIILDEFDVIRDKTGIGSLIKSLSSDKVKFAICGIGDDLYDLVSDHASVERLLEEGSIHVEPMPFHESIEILTRAEELFEEEMYFEELIKDEISKYSQGFPYLVQLIGKECVNTANTLGYKVVNEEVFNTVKDNIANGKAFPTLERQYVKAIGQSEDRKNLLYILANQEEDRTMFDTEVGKLVLKKARKDAEDFDVKHIDQQLPRLLDNRYGPVLRKVPDMSGYYEFINPVFRIYCQLRG